MDITSTMIALALSPATATSGAFVMTNQIGHAPSMVHVKTETGFARFALQTEWSLERTLSNGSDDLRDALRDEAHRYQRLQDGWDGDGSTKPGEASIEAALSFIDRLPAGLTLPGIMLSSEGEVGFYWQLPSGYADISFDSAGAASFYSRPAVGAEVFLENLAMDTFTRTWFFQQLGEMDAPTRQAA